MPRIKDYPGPGHYNVTPQFGRNAKECSLRGGPRMNFQRADGPGPGEYMPESWNDGGKSNVQWKFGSADRFSGKLYDSVSPGPAGYTPRDPCETSAKKTFAPRPGLPDVAAKSPGPGAYSPTRVKDTVRVTTSFGKGTGRPVCRVPTYATAGLESPGPAAYLQGGTDSVGNGGPVARRAASAAFGSAARLTGMALTGAQNQPGPGSYDQLTKSKAPRISITPRRDY